MQARTTIDTTTIREHMPIVCSDGGQFATVDAVEGDYIKVTKDNASNDGMHHWFPTSWITRVDDHVHVDRPGKQAMKDWLSSDPAKS
jgi:hypothetical protein